MRLSIALAAPALLVAGASLAGVRGSGNLRTEARDVPAFDAVWVSAGIHAAVSVGPRKPIQIEADDNILELIETTVRDGVLQIGFKRNANISSSHDVHVSIQAPDLHGVGASAGSEIRGQLARGDEVELDASGGGQVHVRGVEAGELRISGSGGAVIEVQGRADRASIEMSGGTQVKGADLAVKDVRVDGSGGSEAEVRASGQIRGHLSGGSELHVKGNASSRVATSGGSSVDFED
jgi:hypothetical protein